MKQCVVCDKGYFAGDVLEIYEHLCDKHEKEFLKEDADNLRNILRIMKI